MSPVETFAADLRRVFADEVAEYLQRTPRQLPSKYFYDALGSSLFDAICLLPWYRITRAESALLDRYAHEIIAPLARPLTLAELGCGNGEKLAKQAFDLALLAQGMLKGEALTAFVKRSTELLCRGPRYWLEYGATQARDNHCYACGAARSLSGSVSAVAPSLDVA